MVLRFRSNKIANYKIKDLPFGKEKERKFPKNFCRAAQFSSIFKKEKKKERK